MDVTTIALAVDSSQVTTASTALDKLAASGTGAESAASRLAKASTTSGQALNSSLIPAANKGALAFKNLAEAQAALGPAAAAQLQAAGAFNSTAAGATTAAAAVKSLGDQAQRTALTWQQFLGQRMGPVMKDFAAQGLPHTEAHTAAIRQIAAEWQQYKAAGVSAQSAVITQTGATVAAINSMGNAVQQATSKLATRGSGLSSVATEAAAAKSAVNSLDRATTSLGASAYVDFNKVTTSLGATAAKANEATQEVNRLATAAERLGGLSTATTSFGARVGPSTSLRDAIAQRDKENRAGMAADPRLVGGAAAANAFATAAAKATAQSGALGAANKLTAFQTQQLAYQVNDFVVQVASGSNPMMALMQQGAQLQGTFGSIGGAVRAVLSLFTPFRIAMLAAAAAGGVFALALARAESSARSFATIQAQLAGTGRRNLFSTEDLRQFTNELMKLPGVARDTALSVITELSKVHEIEGPLFRELAKLAVDYAKATGTDIPTAAKNLAKAFADPERGAKQLDDALGTLGSGQILAVERMMKLNNISGAQAILLQAVKASVRGVADDAMTPLQKSTKELGDAWERAMQKLDQSKGLRTINELLGKTVEAIAWLIDHSDKIGGLGNVGLMMIPGGQAMAAASIASDMTRNALGLGGSQTPGKREVFGKVTDLSGRPVGPTAAGSLAGAPVGDDEIKRSLETAKSFRSQTGQIADLVLQRKGLQESLKSSIQLYGKESEQAKILRDALEGISERIQGLNQRPQQVADAILQARIKETQTALEKEKATIAFGQKYLQDVYQAGQLSLHDLYEEKRKTIVQGTQAEIDALDKEAEAVRTHLAATKRLSPKDLAKQEQDKARLKEIDAQKEAIGLAGSREVVLANTAEENSYVGLNDQILQYRANLAQLQGDELKAAQLRAQAASNQALILAKQSQGRPNSITPQEIAENQRQVDIQVRLEAAKRGVSAVNEILQQEEDRIALTQQRGAITEIEALKQTGEARSKVAESLEVIVKQMEALAALNPMNIQLQIDTARARLELSKLQSQLNPLKDQLDNMLKGAFSSNFADVLNGKQGPLKAIKSFFNNVGESINTMMAKKVGEQLFGEGGKLGDIGGFISENLFGVKVNKPGASSTQLDTANANLALIRLQTTGADPATQALVRLAGAANQASTAMGNSSTSPTSVLVPPVGTEAQPLTTGDFARFDRAYSGEVATANLFRKTEDTTKDLSKTNEQAAASVLQLAEAATRGADSMTILQQVIRMIEMASGSGGSSGGIGGLIGKGLGAIFGSGGGTFTGTTGLEGLSPDVLALAGYAKGGFTGNTDPRKPAGITHGKEFVFSAPATAHMGRSTLEAMHNAAKTGTFSMAHLATQRVAGNRELGGPLSPNRIYRVNERGPEMLSVNGQHYLMSGKNGGEVQPLEKSSKGNTTVVQVQVTPPVGSDRRTAMQWGETAGRHIQRSLMRNG